MKKLGIIMLAMMLTIALLAGCQSKSQEIVMKVGDREISRGELRIYLTELENMYEQQYGPTIWDMGFEGETIQDIVKNAAKAATVRLNVISMYAQENGIVIDEAAKTELDARAQEYFATFDAEAAKENGITVDVLKKVFYDNAVSDLVMEKELVDFEIDQSLLEQQLAADQEYQTLKTLGYDQFLQKVRARHVLISTLDEDRVAVDEATKATIKEEALNVLAKAKALESLSREEATAGFISLVETYSEDPGSLETGGEYTFGRGEMLPAFEEAAFSLKAGKVSELVETDYGFHIIMVEETIEGSEEDKANLENYEKYLVTNYEYSQKQEAFDAIYLTWEPNYTVEIIDNAYAKVSAKAGTNVTPKAEE